jgi:hypothetical protein
VNLGLHPSRTPLRIGMPSRRTALEPKGADEPELPLVHPVREAKRETARVYEAVRFLRGKKSSVYRRGPESHKVDGRQLSTRELLRLARERGFQ